MAFPSSRALTATEAEETVGMNKEIKKKFDGGGDEDLGREMFLP